MSRKTLLETGLISEFLALCQIFKIISSASQKHETITIPPIHIYIKGINNRSV